jgi:predicted Zn-dependent protease
MTLADYYAAAGRRAEARRTSRRTREGKESFADATTRLAALEVSDGAPAAALKTVERVLAKEPGNATALAMKSRLLLADHKTDDALTEAQNAVKSGPQVPEAQYAAGLAYVAKRDDTHAQSAFREVLKLNPAATAPSSRWRICTSSRIGSRTPQE